MSGESLSVVDPLIAAAWYLLTAAASETGESQRCDDPGLFGRVLTFLAGDDPARLRAAAGYLERALA